MKKIVRTVCIGALSGLAFLAACTAHNGLTRKERKQLIKERDQITQWLGDIWSVGEGNSISLDEYMRRQHYINSLNDRLDTINFCLGDSVDLNLNSRRRAVQQRIDSLNFLIEHYTPACIYGSPEMMEGRAGQVQPKSNLETYEEELEKAQNELKALEKQEIEEQIRKLPIRKPEGRAADVLYGAPRPRNMK